MQCLLTFKQVENEVTCTFHSLISQEQLVAFFAILKENDTLRRFEFVGSFHFIDLTNFACFLRNCKNYSFSFDQIVTMCESLPVNLVKYSNGVILVSTSRPPLLQIPFCIHYYFKIESRPLFLEPEQVKSICKAITNHPSLQKAWFNVGNS